MIIDIIGGGIGGLTTAIALKHKGFKIRVFEQTPTFKPVGAGIILANNAMQVYRHLGLDDEIKNQGQAISSVEITDKNLKLIQNSDLSAFEKKYQITNIAIHRAKLQAILKNQLDKNELFFGHKLINVIPNKNKYKIEFKTNKPTTKIIESEFIIGADGINSHVRKQLFKPLNYRYARQNCWRGVVEFKLETTMENRLIEAWGNGTRFGMVPIQKNLVYWYALKSKHIACDNLCQLFSQYDEYVLNLIKETSNKNIHYTEIMDFKPNKQWIKNNICLIGDAAHAMTPNLGQGACQAIEDAYVLAECLSLFPRQEALKEYEKRRQDKAINLVKLSWLTGKIAHQTNPILVLIRDTLLRLTPNYIQQRNLEKIFKIESFT